MALPDEVQGIWEEGASIEEFTRAIADLEKVRSVALGFYSACLRREAKGEAINQWRAKDRRDGVPPPVPRKERTGSRRPSIEVLLHKRAAEDPAIQGALREYVSMTADELGGMENLRAGQQALLLAQRVTLLIILACEDQLVSGGNLLGEDGNQHAVLGVLEKFLTTFRYGQVTLGLGLRSRMREDGMTLEKIQREYARRNQPRLVPEKHAKKASKDKAG